MPICFYICAVVYLTISLKRLQSGCRMPVKHLKTWKAVVKKKMLKRNRA